MIFTYYLREVGALPEYSSREGCRVEVQDSHARCQKEGLQREIPICILGIKGAQTPGRPRHTIPGLRPHTPPVKNIPGGPPPPSNYYYYYCYYYHHPTNIHTTNLREVGLPSRNILHGRGVGSKSRIRVMRLPGSLGAFDPQNTYRNCSLESLF